MAINLSNVNISLDEFQKISSGWFNAGEVRLKDEHTLAKVNHHVETWFFSNKEKVDHKEVLAIKQALVNALSKNDEPGAITIVTSEPHGFKDKQNRPLHFHWTTTVALDGTATSSPMVIEPPQ